MFIVADKVRARGKMWKGFGVVTYKELKLEDSLGQHSWRGVKGYLRRGKSRRGERFESGRGECVRVKR